MRRPIAYQVGVLRWVLIAALVAIQPLGVFEHVVHDHLGDHSHFAHEAVAHPGDLAAPEHDADHGHVWMTPAVVLVTPLLGHPQGFRAGLVADDVPPASAAPQPPFSPPRA
jgi:hypothetical protein